MICNVVSASNSPARCIRARMKKSNGVNPVALLNNAKKLDSERPTMALNAGTRTRDNVRQQLIASGEFQGRVVSVVNQGCLP